MLQFLVKRFIGLIFVLLCVTFITFILGYFAPGNPIQAMLGNHFDPVLYQQLRHEYGLDLPWYQQYYRFLTDLIHFNFGYSYAYQGVPVWNLISSGLQSSSELATWGLILTYLIGIPLGVFSAIKANTWFDASAMTFSLILYALPTFILAVIFQVFIVWLDSTTHIQWPVANWGTPWQYTWTDIQFKIGPVLVFAALSFASVARITRTSMLEVLRQDFIRTARAKGLRERVVINRHTLRNALMPLITVFGISLGTLVTGVFFIEQIFNIPGLGTTTINAISSRDYPVIQAATILGAIAVVIGNLIADLLYTFVDPRIKAE
jgi:ABC-type dipeptide/oligopeptide/nickel transport system permease component